MLRVLDLFSGIGGFSLGLERAGMETVAFCEFDKKAQLVLKKHWPDVPIYDDVRELTYERLQEEGILAHPISTGRGASKDRKIHSKRVSNTPFNGGDNETGTDTGPKAIDLICGGFPCQPFSVAGKQRGDQDDRHLWPEYFRLIQEIRPRWVIGENVAGLISLGLDQVLSDLEGEGYTVQTFNIPACAVNAPHRRDRLWIVAHTNSERLQRGETTGDNEKDRQEPIDELIGRRCENVPNSRHGANVAHSKCQRQQGQGKSERSCNTEKNSSRETSWINNGGQRWERHWDIEPCMGGVVDGVPTGVDGHFGIEPDIPRVAHGVPNRVDRLKQLGNAVVPQVVEQIGRAIMEVDSNTFFGD